MSTYTCLHIQLLCIYSRKGRKVLRFEKLDFQENPNFYLNFDQYKLL